MYFFGTHPQESSIIYITGKLGKHSYSIVKDLRTAIIVASMMNYFIAPDSMFIHIAGAFRIPTIGLYGPFPSALRMKYFTRSIGIDAKTNCSPCFKHSHHPCDKGDPSPCMAMIQPKHILEAFDEITKEENENYWYVGNDVICYCGVLFIYKRVSYSSNLLHAMGNSVSIA